MTNRYGPDQGPDAGLDSELLRAAIRLNTQVLALVCGLLAASALFVATHISLAYWGSNAGGYLGLLGVFLPGFTVTAGGAWIGAFWAFVFAGLGGGLTYRLYAGLLGERLAQDAGPLHAETDPILAPSTLRLHGFKLGLALGTAVGGSLFLSTSWLILRGTAQSSVHASLLSNYLPGYRVTYAGGLLGAAELFGLIVFCCVLLAAIYNKVVAFRAH